MMVLAVGEGESKVTNIGVGIATRSHVDLEYDAVSWSKAAGRGISGTGCLADLPGGLHTA